jgi:hypothetical protein
LFLSFLFVPLYCLIAFFPWPENPLVTVTLVSDPFLKSCGVI